MNLLIILFYLIGMINGVVLGSILTILDRKDQNQ